MRLRSFVDGAGIVGIALILGGTLSLATTKVVNWFVMTDELYYERLAISVAQTGSLLPRIQGEVISNLNQLYPVLLSLVYGEGDVPASLEAAHRLNAFLMASAAIPVYLLARRIGVGRIASLWVGALAAAVPWLVLSSFLLTEVVAYPAFCWALLALTHATIRRTSTADLLAFAAIALAVVARAQFVILALAFPVALFAEAVLTRDSLGSFARSRPVVVGAYLLALLGLGGAAVSGGWSHLLGSYSVTATGIRLDFDLLRLATEHVAVLAFGLAILPFLVGVGWLIDRVRPSAPAQERAFAVLGCATLVLLTLQVSSFNQRFGAGLVKDRYVFYAVPIVLVALAAAVRSGRLPRWWTFLVPAAICAIGFAATSFPLYQKLNVDSPLAILNDELVRLATSVGWAQTTLVAATVVALLFLVVANAFLPRIVLVGAAAVLATLVLPLETVYAFDRLFAVNGTNGIPVTLDQGGVFNWVDRNVGKDGRVTMIRYPVGGADFWAGVGYWWDAEFWNESVVDSFGDEPWSQQFDTRTGAATRSSTTRYVLVYGSDVRFRLAGKQVVFDRDAYVFEPTRPWRAAWLTDGIYGDGWTRPHVPARITVFSEPGQKVALRRALTLSIASPDKVNGRPVSMVSNLERWTGEALPESSLDRVAVVCVPAGGSATVTIETPSVSTIYRDPSKSALTGEIDRPVGVLIRSIAMADETVPMARCP